MPRCRPSSPNACGRSPTPTERADAAPTGWHDSPARICSGFPSLLLPPDLAHRRAFPVARATTEELPLSVALFYAFAAFTVLCAAGVAFSRNIVYSAFALLGMLFGVAALYVFLAADFVAGAQFLIYIGGILVLILFAVMLTHRIADVAVSNRAVGGPLAFLIVATAAAILGRALWVARWPVVAELPDAPTTHAIGNGFLGPYVLPFELASFVLLAVLVGAIVVSRKELRG